MDDFSVATAAWFLKPQTQAVFACLNREGFEARAVGGAVRNALLGRPVSEVDFATTAKPEDTLRLAEDAGIKTVPTGLSHGTLTLVVDGTPFEVTTLRRDVTTDGRRATVSFGEDWAEDARRRDFTMNALYADAKGQVHDPLGGLNDLLARRVRFIGDASERIREDYLRILRFFRFSAEYTEGMFDREGIAAIIRERHGVTSLSRERVRSELLSILIARRAVDAIEIIDESGLLLLLLGGVARRKRFERLCAVEAALQLQPNPIYRLASLALFVEEDADRISEKLRLSSLEANALTALAMIHPRVLGDQDSVTLGAHLYRLGEHLYIGRLLLAWAASTVTPDEPHWGAAAMLASSWKRPRLPIAGADLIAIGWKPGPQLGKMLKHLEERWIMSGFKASHEDLLEAAHETGPANQPL